MKFTEHFSREEFERSQYATRHGIVNIMGGDALSAAQDLCKNVLEPLRAAYGAPIDISSGFRCTELNNDLGGASYSQHVTGHAVDIDGDTDTLKELYAIITSLDLPFDQLIYEGHWLHISHRFDSNRHEELTARFDKEGVHYSNGIALS